MLSTTLKRMVVDLAGGTFIATVELSGVPTVLRLIALPPTSPTKKAILAAALPALKLATYVATAARDAAWYVEDFFPPPNPVVRST